MAIQSREGLSDYLCALLKSSFFFLKKDRFKSLTTVRTSSSVLVARESGPILTLTSDSAAAFSFSTEPVIYALSRTGVLSLPNLLSLPLPILPLTQQVNFGILLIQLLVHYLIQELVNYTQAQQADFFPCLN